MTLGIWKLIYGDMLLMAGIENGDVQKLVNGGYLLKKSLDRLSDVKNVVTIVVTEVYVTAAVTRIVVLFGKMLEL
jgi:hypothetical protein